MILLFAPAFARPAQLDALSTEALQEAICARTNDARLLAGRPPIPVDDTLHGAARLHAEQMALGGFFLHIAPPEALWPTPSDRFSAVGILNPYPSENIATWSALNYQPGETYQIIDAETFRFQVEDRELTPHTPESLAEVLVAGWMRSPGHRANILATDAVAVGCAASFYWESGFPMFKAVQVFQWFEAPRRSPIARSAGEILAALFRPDAERVENRKAEPSRLQIPDG